MASVKAVSGDVAWVCDASALTEIYRTTNGGKKWLRRGRVTSNELLLNIEALDSTTAFVGVAQFLPGGSGGIYRSTGGGQSWQRVYRSSTFGIAGIHFFDSQNGIAFNEGGIARTTFAIVKTSDGGATWTPIANPPAANRNEFMSVNNFHFFDNQNGWFVTGDIAGTNGGCIFRSTDGGET